MSAPPITERHRPHFHRKAPWLEPVRIATTADITIATALNNGDTLDGITLATDDRVLVKDQSTASQNGVYTVSASPVRAYDLSTDDPNFGFLVYVKQGTVNAGKVFANTNTSAPTIGSTSLTFAEFSSGGGGGAPTTADYLTGTAQGGLSAEIVVGTTPGGELGGTWASPTVDATHSGTNHLQPVRKNSTGTVFERRRLNLIEGSNVTLTVADDAGDDEVDITIAASGTGGTITVEEVDGSPTGSVDKLVLPNGTLGIVGTTATYTPAGGGGGGLAHSFIGRNSVGGSWENLSGGPTQALMKVTLAADSTITAIEAYLRNSAGYHLFYGSAVIYADDSGSPFYPIFASQLNVNITSANGGSTLDNANPRWVKFACGVWLAAGDYWIGVGHCAADVGGVEIAYDTTGGTEWHITNAYWSQPGQSGATGASSVHNHSIRASILS